MAGTLRASATRHKFYDLLVNDEIARVFLPTDEFDYERELSVNGQAVVVKETIRFSRDPVTEGLIRGRQEHFRWEILVNGGWVVLGMATGPKMLEEMILLRHNIAASTSDGCWYRFKVMRMMVSLGSAAPSRDDQGTLNEFREKWYNRRKRILEPPPPTPPNSPA